MHRGINQNGTSGKISAKSHVRKANNLWQNFRVLNKLDSSRQVQLVEFTSAGGENFNSNNVTDGNRLHLAGYEDVYNVFVAPSLVIFFALVFTGCLRSKSPMLCLRYIFLVSAFNIKHSYVNTFSNISGT